jgi:hypothetical protein
MPQIAVVGAVFSLPIEPLQKQEDTDYIINAIKEACLK